MIIPFPQLIELIDDRRIRLPDRTFRMSHPITEYMVIGDRVALWSRSPKGDECCVVPLDLKAYRAKGGLVPIEHFWLGAGSSMSVSADDHRSIIFPGGRIATLPWQPRVIVETSGRFAILTWEASPRNLFLFDAAGELLWQVSENPFLPKARAGFASVSGREDGKLLCMMDRDAMGTFVVDGATGAIVQHIPAPRPAR